ncbi:MAG TPA: hypothetical protein VND15_00975 [Candidatus Acidoferrales bacterium]|nr:hypothetical protein [Candidatus Acidoferrales bacterium]
MHKGIIAYIIIIIAIVVLIYLATGFNFSKVGTIKPITVASTVSTSTTTIAGSGGGTNGTFIGTCETLYLSTPYANASLSEKCASSGGLYGIWVAAGTSGSETVTIKNMSGHIFLTQTSSYNCTTYYDNITLPAQTYNVTLKTGLGGGSCGNAVLRINRTTVAPQQIYSDVYNGNFSTGTYLGWTETNPGFGTAPLNITYAVKSSVTCYQGQPWSGYSGTYFATNYNCGLQAAAGNLTSSLFYASPTKPFLNFLIISPSSDTLYVMVLGINNRPLATAHYNTFNSTASGNSASTFRSASIPLSAFAGEPVKIRIVAGSTNQQTFIAAGGFGLSARPVQTPGILVNLTFNTT